MSEAAWTAYWQGGDRRGCLPGAPPAVQQALATCWTEFAKALPPSARLLDIACGAGAVLETLRAHRADLVLTGADSATLPDIPGLSLRAGVDCAALPFADASFEAVTSQFGLEYCGPAAPLEAARVLAPGGTLRFVLHSRESLAIRHNAARLAAMQMLDAAGLFRLARQQAAGLNDPETAASVRAALATHQGQGIASELPHALGQALATPRPLQRIGELESRAKGEMARLEAMQQAALTREQVEALVANLGTAGITATARTLKAPAEPMLAHLVTGTKPAT